MFRGVRQRSSYPNRCAKYPPSPWGTMLKMRLSKRDLSSFVSGTVFWVQLGLKLACLIEGQKCPELRAKWGFYISNLETATRSKKWGSWGKGQIYFWARPVKYLCFFWRASIFPKTGFSRSTDFAWNHCKCCAQVAAQNRNFSPKGPKSAILELTARWSRNISHCIALQEDKANS